MNNFKFNKDSTDTYNILELSNIIEAYPDALVAIDADFKVLNFNQQCKSILIESNFVSNEAQIVEFIDNYIIYNFKNQLLINNIQINTIQNSFKTTFSINGYGEITVKIGKKLLFHSNSIYLVSFQVINFPKHIDNKAHFLSEVDTLPDNKIELFKECNTIEEICSIFCTPLLKIANKLAIIFVKKEQIAENPEIELLYSQSTIDKFDPQPYKSCFITFLEKFDMVDDTKVQINKLFKVFSLNEASTSCNCNENKFSFDYKLNDIQHLFCIRLLKYDNTAYWVFVGTDELLGEKQITLINNFSTIAAFQLKFILTLYELRKSRAISSQFIDLNPYSIAMADGNGFFVRANKAFAKLWGEVPPKEHNFFNDPILKAQGIIDKMDLLSKGEIDKLEISPFWYNPNHLNPQYPDANRCVEGTMFTINDENTKKTEYYVVMQHDVTEKAIIYNKLLQSEEKYRTIFEHIQDVYFEVDHENIIREISPSVELYTQYKRDEIINTSFLQYLVEPERMTDFFGNLFKYGRVRDSEIKIYDRNKEILTCASNCILVQRSPEEKFMIIGSLTNISDLIKIRNQLIETQYKYSEIINNIGQGIGILDENEMFVFANPAANQIFEVVENGLIGRNIAEFVDGEQLAFIKQQTEERKRGLKNKYSLKINTPGGKIKYIQLTASPQYDENNNFYGSLGIFQDITESQFLQQELQKSEEKYRELFENANDIIYTMDLNGNFTSINRIAEKILGYSIEEIKQIHLRRIVDSNDYHISQNSIMEAVKRQEQHSRHEIDAYTKDGRKVVFDINSFLKFKDGKPYEIFGIARDITARKLAEQKVIDALAEKEILLREVHHRVKNNMQVIMSLINFQITDDLEEGVKDKLKELRERIRTMSLIHEDLYISEELAKVEFGIYLEKLIGNVSNIFDAQAKGINIVLETKVVIMDIEKAIPCGMIVNEMLSNSLKYAFPEEWLITKSKNFIPTIKISFKISKGIYVLTFEDNGIGLPEKIEKKKKTTLGLWLINILTKDQLNGKISINRKNGTKYSIKFLKNIEK